jgi:predicted nucleic acid-binding protein
VVSAIASPPGGVPARLRVLFDTSALIKRYAAEEGRERVLALFAVATELVVAAHCKTEMAAALLRKWQDKSLSRSEYERAWCRAEEDVADMEQVPVDAHVERFAVAAMEHSPLRTLDALHVGSALAARVDLFVTADRRQAHVAQQMGLKTECVAGTPIGSHTKESA